MGVPEHFDGKAVYTVKIGAGSVSAADSCRAAVSFFSRLKGLLGTDSIPAGSALIISPCTGVHTFFMRYPIDVMLVGNQKVIAIYNSLKPFRMTTVHPLAEFVVELPAGTLAIIGAKTGDLVAIEEKP